LARFNTPTVDRTKTVNLAGGEAYQEDPKLEFASILLTSFVQDQFYRAAKDTLARLSALMGVVPALFAAKAAIFARDEFGMRSISHVVAGELTHSTKGEPWMRRFIKRVIVRPDDITEIVSYVLAKYGKPLPNALKRGIADRLELFSEYQLAKYRSEGKAVSMVDVVNLTHPRSTVALSKLMRGELKSTETWEAKLSEAGKAEDKGEAKKQAWAELLRENKLGYMALLRNINNITKDAPEVVDVLCAQLQDEARIKKSRVLPFRFMSAFEALDPVTVPREVVAALAAAMDIAVCNVPVLPGQTLVAVDVSGSMLPGFSVRRTERSPIETASVFAGALMRHQPLQTDIMLFSTDATYLTVSPNADVLSTSQLIRHFATGGGTDFKPIFARAGKAYDRIILLTDMQGWVGYNAPTAAFEDYKRRTGANPHVFSLDLAGHGTLQFPQNRVYCLAGFSEKVFDIMALLEQDRNALVARIEAVEL